MLPAGLEPATYRLRVGSSNQLSYGSVCGADFTRLDAGLSSKPGSSVSTRAEDLKTALLGPEGTRGERCD